MKNKIELLSPAGCRESVIAAVNGGCDSVYLGGESFNARVAAKNFAIDEINSIIDYCHLRGVKVYITLNTLYKDRELYHVRSFAEEMYKFGADAFIIHDMGFLSLIRKSLPDIKLHASTQMTVHNLEGVKFLENAGFDRVVLSRELSIPEVLDIAENSKLEIETFIHGALCVCYSGRCLFSSQIGGRSGNRGRCAQPCRLKYSLMTDKKKITDGYLLSPKDLMGLNLLPELKGVSALKIEGRMKSPEYVAAVTSVYRKYIDLMCENNPEPASENDIKEIMGVFSRGGGFTEGYYTSYSTKEMISPFPKSSGIYIGVVKKYNSAANRCDIYLEEELVPGDGIEIWTREEPHAGTNISKAAAAKSTVTLSVCGEINQGDLVYKSYDKRLMDRLKSAYSTDTRKQNVSGEFEAKLNKPLYLKLGINGVFAECMGDVPEPALNLEADKASLLKRLSKTGNTPFTITFDKFDLDGGLYLPVKAVNELRRRAADLLAEKLGESYKREPVKIDFPRAVKSDTGVSQQYLTVYVSNDGQFKQAVKFPGISTIYVELNKQNYKNMRFYTEAAHKNGIEVFAALPEILRLKDRPFYKEALDCLEKSDVDGYLLRNFDELNTQKKLALDYTFNIFNSASVGFSECSAHSVMLSPELNLTEIEALACENAEILVYGKLPLMTTVQCPVGLYAANKDNMPYCRLKGTNKQYYLSDRKNMALPLVTKCDFCYAQILNGTPIFMLNKLGKFNNVKYLRLNFTTEPCDLVYDIIYSFDKILSGGIPDDRTARINEYMEEDGFTYGHFFRGVL